MRVTISLCLLVAAGIPALAQEQENKLMDRLLRPNMALESSAQNKKFNAGNASATKQATVRSFSVAEKTLTKPFQGERTVTSKQYAAQLFRDGDATASASKQSYRARQMSLRSDVPSVRRSPDAEKEVSSSDYAGNRPFLGRGKSQKALSQKDTPLTIEQIRELLNRNK